MLILPAQQRIVQPKAPRIDWNNPINNNLLFCAPLGNLNRDIVGDRVITLASGASLGTDYKGESLKASGSAGAASVPINLSACTKITVSFWMWWDAFANNDKLALEFTSNFSTANGFMIDPNSAAPASGYIQMGTGSPGTNVVRSSRPTAMAWHHYVFTFDRTTGTAPSAALWIDGIAQSVTAVGTVSDVSDNFANSTLYIFSRNNTSLFGAGRMQNLCIRNGISQAAAIAESEYKNPWQIFQPDRRAVYFGFGASSQSLTQSATLTDTDTFYAPTVNRGAVTLLPSLYSDADTFYTPTVSQNAGTQSLAQSATFTDADTFYTPAVSVGAVMLSPALFTDADAFYAPAVTQASPQTLTQAEVFENGNIFFEHRFASGAVGKPKFIWAKAKAKIGDVPAEGKQQIIKAAKKQAKIDAVYDPCVLEYNDIQIKPPIVSDDEQVEYRAAQAYRRAYYAAIQQRIEEHEQDEEDTLLALML